MARLAGQEQVLLQWTGDNVAREQVLFGDLFFDNINVRNVLVI